MNPFLKPDAYYEYKPTVAPRKKHVPSYMRPTKSSELKNRKKSIWADQGESKEEVENWSTLESSSVVRSLLKCYEEDFVDEDDLDSTWLSSTCPEDSWFLDDSADESIVNEKEVNAFNKGEGGVSYAVEKEIERANPTLAAPLVISCSPHDAVNGPWIKLVPTRKRHKAASQVKEPGYLRSTSSSSRKRRLKSPKHMKSKALRCA